MWKHGDHAWNRIWPVCNYRHRKKKDWQQNYAGIDISKDFSRMKCWLSLSISVALSIVMNRFPDGHVATVLSIVVESRFSGNWCINRSYCLFFGHEIPLDQARSTFNRGIREGADAKIEGRDSPYANKQKHPRKRLYLPVVDNLGMYDWYWRPLNGHGLRFSHRDYPTWPDPFSQTLQSLLTFSFPESCENVSAKETPKT
jgi:hypothetical protein